MKRSTISKNFQIILLEWLGYRVWSYSSLDLIHEMVLLEITPEQQTYQKEHETQHFRVKRTLILDHIDGNFREFNYGDYR